MKQARRRLARGQEVKKPSAYRAVARLNRPAAFRLRGFPPEAAQCHGDLLLFTLPGEIGHVASMLFGVP